MRVGYRQTVMRDRPILVWPCGDSSILVPSPDISGRSGPTPTHTNLIYGTPGPFSQGRAVGFVDVNFSRMVASSGVPNPGDIFSYEIWVRRGSLGNLDPIISSVSGGYFLRFNGDNTIHMLRSQVVDALGTTASYTDQKNFIHIVNTNHSSLGRSIWVNGVQRANFSGVSTGFGNSNQLRLSVENATLNDATTQTLWGLSVYNYVLSRSQILNHYAVGRGFYKNGSRRR